LYYLSTNFQLHLIFDYNKLTSSVNSTKSEAKQENSIIATLQQYTILLYKIQHNTLDFSLRGNWVILANYIYIFLIHLLFIITIYCALKEFNG